MRASTLRFSTVFLLLVAAGCAGLWQKKPAPATVQAPPDSLFSGDAFDLHVRTTEARTPEEERASFTLPPGFRVELFAAEPQIGKPTNLAFDAKGRLWVTQSVEYPFPAQPGKGRDRLTILEDRDHDGRADTFTPVADTLNIPIGILPEPDGAIAFSIPNVYRYTDANGDDRPESARKLLGPFGFKDTHGMVNHLTRGFDGWVYACHGFTNLSRVAGRDGDTITLGSGNTFRFRADGSRAEQTTRGRVNPFGLTFDDWGYQYSSDCHSSPLYQLIMGADYPYFGRLPEGIGFAPAMKPHEREATALSGLALASGSTFPEPYRTSFYLGDVVKCRIYRASYQFRGSSPAGKMEADFLRSTDPWFRPVDVVQGPDGALYVADFYNRIIGHYEVPLDNPGRDRVRGRIWRITYDGVVNRAGWEDYTKAPLTRLIEALGADNLPLRMTAAEQLVRRVGGPAVAPLVRLLGNRRTRPVVVAHALWVLRQLGALPDDALTAALRHPDPLVRTHALRVVLDGGDAARRFQAAVVATLDDPNPHVQRAAVEALARYPDPEMVRALVRVLGRVPDFDTHLAYTIKLCLRNLLRQPTLGEAVTAAAWTPAEQTLLAEPLSGVSTAYAARFLRRAVEAVALPRETELRLLRHAALYLPPNERDELTGFVRKKYAGDPASQYRLYAVVRQAVLQQGGTPGASLRAWGTTLAGQLIDPPKPAWTYALRGGLYLKDAPVALRTPPVTTELSPDLRMVGFDQGGFRGVVRSPAFEAPATLRFSVVNSNPKTTPDPENGVLLRLASDTTRVIARQFFPKTNDYRAPTVTWDLSAYRGQRVVLEVVDNSSGVIWVGDFNTPALRVPDSDPKAVAEQQRFAIETAGEYGLAALEPTLRRLLDDPASEDFIRLASARALLRLAPERYVPRLVARLSDGEEQPPLAYRKDVAALLGETPLAPIRSALEVGLKRTSGEVQLELLKALAASAEGKDWVLAQVQGGTLATRTLVQPGLEDRLLLNATPRQRAEFNRLTANLSPVDETREALIQARLARLTLTPGLREGGRQVFLQHCSACHQINKEGGMIGPQLDGIGSWGSRALATKILDPNRNISEAFRTYTIRLRNGTVRTGLFRREEPAALVFADAAGQEFIVPKKDVLENQASRHTLMPDHFRETIPEDQFNSLLNYLLSVK